MCVCVSQSTNCGLRPRVCAVVASLTTRMCVTQLRSLSVCLPGVCTKKDKIDKIGVYLILFQERNWHASLLSPVRRFSLLLYIARRIWGVSPSLHSVSGAYLINLAPSSHSVSGAYLSNLAYLGVSSPADLNGKKTNGGANEAESHTRGAVDSGLDSTFDER